MARSHSHQLGDLVQGHLLCCVETVEKHDGEVIQVIELFDRDAGGNAVKPAGYRYDCALRVSEDGSCEPQPKKLREPWATVTYSERKKPQKQRRSDHTAMPGGLRRQSCAVSACA